MKRTWISPLMLVAVLVPLLLVGSLACSDLVGSEGNDVARVSEVVAEISFQPLLTGRALVVEGSNLCFTIQKEDCAGWCEWEDRDDCPYNYCVKQPPPNDPPPPRMVTGMPFVFSTLAPVDLGASKQCAGWCDWEDRDDCPSTWCVNQHRRRSECDLHPYEDPLRYSLIATIRQ